MGFDLLIVNRKTDQIYKDAQWEGGKLSGREEFWAAVRRTCSDQNRTDNPLNPGEGPPDGLRPANASEAAELALSIDEIECNQESFRHAVALVSGDLDLYFVPSY